MSRRIHVGPGMGTHRKEGKIGRATPPDLLDPLNPDRRIPGPVHHSAPQRNGNVKPAAAAHPVRADNTPQLRSPAPSSGPRSLPNPAPQKRRRRTAGRATGRHRKFLAAALRRKSSEASDPSLHLLHRPLNRQPDGKNQHPRVHQHQHGQDHLPSLGERGTLPKKGQGQRAQEDEQSAENGPNAVVPLGIRDANLLQISSGCMPMLLMLQATMTFSPRVRAFSTSSSLSEPGFKKSSRVPFRAISSTTLIPTAGGRKTVTRSKPTGISETER